VSADQSEARQDRVDEIAVRLPGRDTRNGTRMLTHVSPPSFGLKTTEM